MRTSVLVFVALFFLIGPNASVGQTIDGLKVDANGNVGVGTASPAALLDVNGHLRATSAYISDLQTDGTVDIVDSELDTLTISRAAILTRQSTLHLNGGPGWEEDKIVFNGGQTRITTHDGNGQFQLLQGADGDNNCTGSLNGAAEIEMNENGNIDFKVDDDCSDETYDPVRTLRIDRRGKVQLLGPVAAADTVEFQKGASIGSNLDVDGTVTATSVTETSARRFKTDVEPLVDALDIVSRLRGVRYRWKTNGNADLGFIAEDVARVLPEIVTYEDDGTTPVGLNYGRLTAVLVEALQEQTDRADALQDRVDALHDRVATLEDALRESGVLRSDE